MRVVSVATPDFKSFLSQITFFVPQITENLASEILKMVELILIPLHQHKTLPSIPVAWDIAGSVLATPRRWDCTRHPCASLGFVEIRTGGKGLANWGQVWFLIDILHDIY